MNRLHDIHHPSSAFRHSFLLLTLHLSLLTLFFVLPTFAQQRWERTYGGTNDDEGYSVQQTSDGGYIVAGETSSFGAGSHDVYLIKTNASGDTLWTRTYGGMDYDYALFVQQTSDGGYILTGGTYSFGAGGDDVYLIKADATGDTLWTRTYGGSSHEYGSSVQQTSDGGYILVGTTFSFGSGNGDVYLIKTNASGDTIWTRTYGGTNEENGASIQQTSDGGYIIAGFTFSFGSGHSDIYLLKTNASGDTIWTRTYGGAGYDYGFSVRQTSDGGYVVGGGSSSFGSQDQVYLIKTNASGDTIWNRTYGGTRDEGGNSVQQTSDSGYIICGSTSSFGDTLSDVYLIKTDANGDTLWTRTYGGTNWDYGRSVQQTSDGGYIITGGTWSFGDSIQVYLIKTDSLGNSTGVEESQNAERGTRNAELRITPNPFVSFAILPGHEGERFNLYDISGRKVGTYKGDRIGEGLGAGVYFLRSEGKDAKSLRVVKVR